jgi:protein TonB
VLASILLHAAVLSLRFGFPDPARLRQLPQSLDVVLVNSKSPTRPTEAEVLAQANLDRGGDTDENRRASTPLPVTRKVEQGDDLKRARKRAAEPEAKPRQLMAQARAEVVVPAQPATPTPAPEPQPAVSGADLMNSALALARMEAQIARRIEEYNKRPR